MLVLARISRISPTLTNPKMRQTANSAEVLYRSMATGSSPGIQYQLPSLENVEDVEKYRLGGFHPIKLGDRFMHGRYRVLHKLGFGGFSTVWLARDEQQNRLVSLKVLTAEASRQPSELKMLQRIDDCLQGTAMRKNLLAVLDSFTLKGPNGVHVCHVSQLGGPSLAAICDSPGEIAGTRRIRATLAWQLARQLAKLISLLHDLDIVHGDITPKNVCLQLSGFDTLSTSELYRQLGTPVEAELFKVKGEKPGASAPEYVVEAALLSNIDTEYLSQKILLIDLGEAFLSHVPPPNGLGTPTSYRSPELITEGKASKASDIWAMACTIFEMRSGFPLFESFVGSYTEILKEMFKILGRPPDCSHPLWRAALASDDAQLGSLEERIREIGRYDRQTCDTNNDDGSSGCSALLEAPGRRVSEQELQKLANLLKGALEYSPEKRSSAQEVLEQLHLENIFPNSY